MPNCCGDRDFRLVAGSVGLSAFGDWVAIVALGLQVKEMTGAGLEVAALWICLFGPSVALAAHAGLLVDRVETTRLLALVSAAGAAVALAAGCCAARRASSRCSGSPCCLARSSPSPSRRSSRSCPLLAGRERAQEANGHVETARYVGFGLGPLVGGIAFAAGGLGLAMAIDALTFALVAIAATRLRVRRAPSDPASDRRPIRARAGIAVLLDDRVLRAGHDRRLQLAAVHVRRLGRRSSSSSRTCSGAATSPTGSCSRSGPPAWRSARWRSPAGSPRPRSPASALLAVVVQGLGLALPAVLLGFGFFLVCAFAGGVAHGVKNVMFRSLIHQRVPERLHGRAFAAFNGLRNTAELAAFGGGGLLVAAIGARGTLAYAGTLSALAGLVGLRSCSCAATTAGSRRARSARRATAYSSSSVSASA